jgi:signal transduction histidine kinase/FixJ family two-component response regulator
MNSARILIADDHTLICDALRKVIEPPHQVVATVNDGMSLLEIAPVFCPDIVLLDITMPLLNGLDAGRQLKQALPKTMLIFLTMHPDCDLAAEAFRIGASGYLLKNSAGPELLKAIQQVLSGGKYIAPPIADGMEQVFRRDPRALKRNRNMTDRQRQILQLIAEGYSMEQIGLHLKITPRTVAFHKYRIMEEFGIGNNAELVRFALKHHLVPSDENQPTAESSAQLEPAISRLCRLLNLHLVLLDRNGIVVAVGDRWAQHNPHPVTIGDCYIDAFARAAGTDSQSAATARVGVRAVLRGERPQFQMEYRCEQQRPHCWFVVTVAPMGDADGHVIVIHRDISRDKNSEQTLRELRKKLIRAQEGERSRIARELHDDISQRLALLTIELRRIPNVDLSCLDAEVSYLCRKVDEIASDIHSLSHCLDSTKLHSLGLGAALRGLCAECSRQRNINIECCCAELPTGLAPEMSLSLFRVAQEALSNVLKHSRARNASVKLTCEGGGLSLRISDDGVGLSGGQATAEEGLGLVSMRERLHVIDGMLTVYSRPFDGTEIEARVPLRKSSESVTSALRSAA